MKDLLVITPSRGRPQKLAAMIDACLSLSEACTTIAVGTDDDDPERRAYEKVLWPAAVNGHVRHFAGTRRTLAGWTNLLAEGGIAEGYRALASLGDDHVPRTQGWDRLLLEALDKLGGEGIAYGNDLHQGEALPTAPVISSGIVEALGYMMVPELAHMHVDDAWRDLGQAAGCLAYVPEVVIEHQHPDAGKAVTDETYAGSAAGLSADRDAYHRWRNERMAADVAKVRALRERAS